MKRFVFVLGVFVVALAGCGGGGSKGNASGAPATASVANFCRDYTAAAYAYQQTSGDVSDPNFAQFVSRLTTAQAEAPAAVKSDVTGMLNEAKKITAESSSAHSVTGDLTAASSRVSDWGASHCSNNGAGGSNTTSTAQPPAAVTTATTTTKATTTANGGSAQIRSQLAGLDAILNLAKTGRQALANGDLNAAIANRR
jgi:hypothetical protein